MELKDRVVVVTEHNMSGIYDLYGQVDQSELEGIVNRYLAIAIEEIKEDENNLEINHG
ncbi:hypothetical protein BXY41_12146 [Lacrimispora xylanisolvens]|uniref:Uncharacterized protein n=1 Tax=Lacrimispora xylanisolvens TaxID=384636 RepID=A0A2S6HCG0_9FIRM|nr:hypothetical protein [Hungatella xylanolytica]PPK75140.1 hypothetical protein BXY41_12146 [Hungatella xylanolytica]